MSTNAPVSTRTEFTIVDGPSRKRLATLQVSIDLATDQNEKPRDRVVFALRDWNGGGKKEFATGRKIRRGIAITSIDWRSFDDDGLVTIKGIMSRGVKIRCYYDPQKREGELVTENSDLY